MKTRRGCIIGIAHLVFWIALVSLVIHFVKKREDKEDEQRREWKERDDRVNKFLNRFDEYSLPCYLPFSRISEIIDGEYDVCSNMAVGDPYIIHVGVFFLRSEDGFQSYAFGSHINKITINIGLDDKSESENIEYVLCHIKSISQKNYKGGCHIICDGIMTFSGEDIYNDPGGLYNRIMNLIEPDEWEEYIIDYVDDPNGGWTWLD